MDNIFSNMHLFDGSVLDANVDIIVNAANCSLLGGGGVDGAIHRAAGPQLLEECRTLNGCDTGDAKITSAYNISNAKFIVHTVGPVYRNNDIVKTQLSNCYSRSLDLALNNHCNSIAFPCISTGAYGYPILEACQIAYNTVKEWLLAYKDKKIDVYFCCFNNAELEAFKSIWDS